jgi:hypothetical protein
MGLFQSYTQPGVYTSVSIEDGGISLFGDQRIPVLIGEGQETRSFKNAEIHRGSSSVADDRRVLENLSDQVTGTTRTFVLNYGPVVDGTGKGVVTNNTAHIQVYADGNPVVVTSLDGNSRTFTTQQIFAQGTDLRVNYYFKRKDTFIKGENLTDQVPSFATWTNLAPKMVLTLAHPGFKGNSISLALVYTPTAPKQDINAVSGVGTDIITIELAKPLTKLATTGAPIAVNIVGKSINRAVGSWIQDGFAVGDGIAIAGTNNTLTATVMSVTGDTLVVDATLTAGTDTLTVTCGSVGRRTLYDLKNIIEAGIPTLSSANIVISSFDNSALLTVANAAVATNFAGGIGQDTDNTFKVKNVPIVDGTDGGVVTMNPKNIVVRVNGLKVPVSSVNGQYGLFTLPTGVPAGAYLEVDYYTNTYQDTYDDLPYTNVSEINLCGFAPNRNDFIDGTDFVLENDRIYWGNAYTVKTGQFTAGYSAFDATYITPTMVDEFMFRRPLTGLVNGRNVVFQLEDSPTDGAGRTTDNVDLIKVFVGEDPISARQVKVTRLNGATGEVTLQMPPATNKAVFASYNRCTLQDHEWTMSVVTPGITGQGTYRIQNENGVAAPILRFDPAQTSVAAGAFSNTGIVWPFSFSDLRGVAGATPNETITVTFLDDDLSYQFQPPTAAHAEIQGLKFTATTPGAAVNGKVRIAFVGSIPGEGKTDAHAVEVVVAEGGVTIITVYITDQNNATRSLGAIRALFLDPNNVSGGAVAGRIRCDQGTADLSALAVDSTAVALSNGADEVVRPYAVRYKVTSSRDAAAMAQDGLGRTGGDPNDPSDGIGFLGQTYLDPNTAVAFTIVDPTNALNEYGYTSMPSPSYRFTPGDKLVFTVSDALSLVASPVPTLTIPGLSVVVNSTYNMHPGDTAILSTYNKAGKEPKVGEFYYLSVTTEKPDSDYDVKLFTNAADAYALYGDPTPANRLALAVAIFVGNSGSGQVFACKQVKRDLGDELASDNAFMDAISSMATPLPGSDRKCDVICTTSTSPAVQQFLAKHLDTQASTRNRAEAIGFIGLDITATPEDARALARNIKSERIILVYPGGAILSVEQDGGAAEFAVDGSFLAAGLCGVYCNPANDVATTLTRQTIVGFNRLVRRTEDSTMDLMAADGVTLLTDASGAFRVRHYLTTRQDNVITAEPTCTTITDYVRQRTRKVLEQFIGRKNLQNVLNDVAIVMHALLKALIEQEIIEAYRGLDVVKDDADPRVLHVKVAFKPVFSLLWISVEFNVSTKG